jgi:hypothetical protein
MRVSALTAVFITITSIFRKEKPEEGGSKFLRNAGIYLPAYTASHRVRRPVIPPTAYLLFKICLIIGFNDGAFLTAMC